MKKNPWKLSAKNPTDHYYVEAGRGREFVYTFPQKVRWNEKHRMKNLFISLSITKLARSSCKL